MRMGMGTSTNELVGATFWFVGFSWLAAGWSAMYGCFVAFDTLFACVVGKRCL